MAIIEEMQLLVADHMLGPKSYIASKVIRSVTYNVTFSFSGRYS